MIKKPDYQEGQTYPGKGILMPDGSFSNPTPETPALVVPPTPIVPTPTPKKENISKSNLPNGVEVMYNNDTGEMKDSSGKPLTWDVATNTWIDPITKKPPVPSDTTSSTNSSTDSNTLSQEKDTLSKQRIADAQVVFDQVTGIQNGSIPLSAGENAQIEGLKQQYQQMIDQQNLINTGAEGTANIRGYQQGAAEYDPTFQNKIIGSIITAGTNKILDLNTKMASAVSALTQSFKDNDIAKIKSAYDSLDKARSDRQTEIQKTIDDSNKAIQAVFDNAEKVKKDNLDALIHDDTVSYQDKQQAIALAQLDETTRHNKETELLAKQAAGGGSGMGGTMPSVSMNGDNTVNVKSQADFLAGLPGGANGTIGTMIRGISDYSLNPSSFSTSAKQSQGGLTQAQIITLAKQYDPTFDQSQYANRQALKKNFQSGAYSKNINSLNTAIGHLADLQSNFDKLDNANFTPYNHAKNTIEKLFGAGSMTSAGTNIAAVMGELASTFKSGGATDQEIKNLGTVDVYSSPEQVKSFIETATQLLASRLDALNETYTSAMGKANDKSFLSPTQSDNLLKLQQKGYDIQVPDLVKNPTVILSTFNSSSPENASLLQQLKTTMPNASPAEIVSFLENNGQLQ